MSTSQKQSNRRFQIDPFEPAYLTLQRSGELARRAKMAVLRLNACSACPRNCRVARSSDEKGFCRTGRYAAVSSASPHFGEEDCLRGHGGSGTIFFGSCNLGCVFCQNADISHREPGRGLSGDAVAEIMLTLQESGCHNINLVTPTHVVPQLIEAIEVAARRGLQLPIVYNTSGYDSVGSLQMLDGIVDIYMPDFKFWSPETAERLCNAEDYPRRARAAIAEMHRQVGPLCFGPDGIARRGVLLRHLVMPGQLDEAAAIFRYLAEEISPDTYVNIMAQYRPEYGVGRTGRDGQRQFAEIDRPCEPEEIAAAHKAAIDAGLRGFDDRV